MNRFWAVRFGATGLDDHEGRYRVVVGVRGKVHAPDCLRLAQVAVQDAADPIGQWEPGRTWDQFVHDRNLWMRGPAGQRYIGWGHRPGRYVVDLSKTAPWAAIIVNMLNAARSVGYDGIQLDDASEVLFLGFGVPQGCWDPRAWRENSRAIIRACAGPHNAMAGWWRTGYTRPESFMGYGMTKMEGVRFAPRFWNRGWGGTAENPKLWQTWFSGDENHLGILGLEKLGVTPLLEAQYDPTWDVLTYSDYAWMTVVTTCLADRAMLAFHEDHVWTTPVWTEAHGQAWRLGEPTSPRRLDIRTGLILRDFDHGCVALNATDRDAPECPAHSARIYTK